MQVSGKDLINNHLTFALYNHTPSGRASPGSGRARMRTNGHLLLNAEKMSKSTGAPVLIFRSYLLEEGYLGRLATPFCPG